MFLWLAIILGIVIVGGIFWIFARASHTQRRKRFVPLLSYRELNAAEVSSGDSMRARRQEKRAHERQQHRHSSAQSAHSHSGSKSTHHVHHGTIGHHGGFHGGHGGFGGHH